jgi:uncharacterized membrane protein YeaQ/YmgE (transglycosylase-associated protein family)
MGILSWIIVGAVAGMLAGLVMRGQGFGFLGDVVVGIVGACIGGGVAVWNFHVPDPMNGINLTSILVASLGAIVFIILIRFVQAIGARR